MNLYCFDFFGRPVGHIDETGVCFDSRGVRWAQLRADHDVYDLAGRYVGRIGLQGCFHAADGICSWYVRDWDWLAPLGVEEPASGAGGPLVARSRAGHPATRALVVLRVRPAAY